LHGIATHARIGVFDTAAADLKKTLLVGIAQAIEVSEVEVLPKEKMRGRN
jgi:hypothetical protein